jgi:hypothetical protein
MLCARATLTAGPRHKRYKAGTSVRAVVFMKAIDHPSDLKNETLVPIAARGWKRITISGHKVLPNDHKFSTPEAEEAKAFQAALENGVGIVVLGLVP